MSSFSSAGHFFPMYMMDFHRKPPGARQAKCLEMGGSSLVRVPLFLRKGTERTTTFWRSKQVFCEGTPLLLC